MQVHKVTLLFSCLLGVFLTAAVAPAGACPDGILRVTPGSPTTENGCSWGTAFNDLQEALAVASPGDQIWVARGTYTPGLDPADVFELTTRVRIYGGLVGNETPSTFNPPNVDNRDFLANETILSGDLGGGGESYAIVSFNGADDRWRLDGFTITGASDHAIYCEGSSPTLENLILTRNHSSGDGAALYNFVYSSPVVENCRFFLNAAAGSGGAVANSEYSDPTFGFCEFQSNEAAGNGGAVASFASSHPDFYGCVLSANRAAHGGAVYNDSNCPLTARNTTFQGNVATAGYGGGISCPGNSTATAVTLINCRILDNVAAEIVSQGLGGGGLFTGSLAQVRLINTVFRGNSTAEDHSGGGLYCSNPQWVKAMNCLIAGNLSARGGGWYWTGVAQPAETYIVNTTIADNLATLDGGGCYFYSLPTTRISVRNSIFAANADANGAATDQQAQIFYTNGDPPAVTYSFITALQSPGPFDDLTNKTGEPGFVQAAGGVYRLHVASTCINQGTNTNLPLDDQNVDEDGLTSEETPDLDLHTRVVASAVDMGAYEYALTDCDSDGDDVDEILEEIHPDCNGNWIPDNCELANHDCNPNATLDECDIASGTSNDCQQNGTPDDCEFDADCNHNCVEDADDITAQTSLDANENGIPDECEFPLPRRWTSNADFDEGTLLNVNHDAQAGELQRNPIQKSGAIPGTKPLPFIWVALSGRGTVARILTEDESGLQGRSAGTIVGEYWTAPGDRPKNPSRTTVDLDGSCYAGNRDEVGGAPARGSIVKIGIVIGGNRVNENGVTDATGEYLAPPFDYCTCEDRDGDGRIRTSRGVGDVLAWPNPMGVNTDGGISAAEDECILRFERTAGTGVRTLAIDKDNNLWVGGQGNQVHEKRDGFTGNAISEAYALGCGGYGGLVAHAYDAGNSLWFEFLWSARGAGTQKLLRFDTVAETESCSSTHGNYGLGFDPTTSNIWHTSEGNTPVVYEIDALSNSVVHWYNGPTGFGGAKGVAVDNKGHVWIAEYNGDEVLHLAPDPQNPGSHYTVGTVGGLQGTTGVAVDAQGEIWVSEMYGNAVSRIDPEAGAQNPSGSGVHVGAVDLTVPLGLGASPYNYSDLVGVVGLHATGVGTWSVVHDSLHDGTEWCQVRWNQEGCSSPPSGTSLQVDVRAADHVTGLPALSYHNVPSSGSALGGVGGRFIQVRVRFHGTYPHPDVPFATPSLCDLTVVPATCLKGDVNRDGLIDGRDIQPFVDVILGTSTQVLAICPADTNGRDGIVDINDVPCFVALLVNPQEDCAEDAGCGGGGGRAQAEDCNGNSVADVNDVYFGTSQDCNHNWIPDECDVDPNDPDGNGLVSNDVNSNGIPDECEPDCNQNGVPDDWDIVQETSADIDSNGVPDECQPDCNDNSVPDYWDVDSDDPDGNNLVSADCDGNGVPDECQRDCNQNGVPDVCDIDPNDPDGDEVVWPDCNGNHRPDACDFNWPPPLGSLDCNENGIPDECDIVNCPENDPSCQDCNGNGFPDGCDIAAEISLDENENGVPDECEGEGLMGGGMMQQESLFFGDPEARWAAWAEYYDWARQQDWGPNSSVSSAEQFRVMADKLRELGLPVRNPWAR